MPPLTINYNGKKLSDMSSFVVVLRLSTDGVEASH